jgi:hypothetical protein
MALTQNMRDAIKRAGDKIRAAQEDRVARNNQYAADNIYVDAVYQRERQRRHANVTAGVEEYKTRNPFSKGDMVRYIGSGDGDGLTKGQIVKVLDTTMSNVQRTLNPTMYICTDGDPEHFTRHDLFEAANANTRLNEPEIVPESFDEDLFTL